MPRGSGADAEAVVTAIAAIPGTAQLAPLQTGDYLFSPLGQDQEWPVRFVFGAGLAPGETRTVRFWLKPASEARAQLTPGMEFELRTGGQTVALGHVTRCWFGCAEGFGVHTLSLDEFRAIALPAMERIFRLVGDSSKGRPDDIEEPFLPNMPCRGIVDCSPPFFELDHCRAFASVRRSSQRLVCGARYRRKPVTLPWEAHKHSWTASTSSLAPPRSRRC